MPASADENEAASLFESIRGNAAMLRVFIQAMPKGADLHNHLGGSVYAEDFLKVAARRGMCADAAISRIEEGPCEENLQIATLAERQPFVYARLVNALSTRGYQRGVGAGEVSGHTQFFSSFERFGAVQDGSAGHWLALARESAERNAVGYLELMLDPPVLMRWAADAGDEPLDESEIAALFTQERGEVERLLPRAIAELDGIEADAAGRLSCDTPQADPACAVELNYLAYALRSMPPRFVFRTLVASFAMARRDPRVVGVNIVMPEDDPVALRDYRLHMAMFRLLHGHYPEVKMTMHAGELALGLVPPEDLEDHIALALDAGASRIGHGTAIAYERSAPETLARMAREGIALEANLTSNAVILGVAGSEHPIRLYRAMGVPVTLSTDDEGVLRSDMSQEYRRAALEQGFSYRDLKALARNGIQYSFAQGQGLWRERRIGDPVAPCAKDFGAPDCRTFLAANRKARLQAALEADFARFEASLERFAPLASGASGEGDTS